MKIAYLCADVGIPIRGNKGASVHVREMVSALVAQGHDVRVFAANAGEGNALAAPLYTIAPLHTTWPDACTTTPDRPARPITRHPYEHLPPPLADWAGDLCASRRLSAPDGDPAHTATLHKEMRELAYNRTLYQRVRALFRSWRPDLIYERYSLFNVAGLHLAEQLAVPHVLEVNAPLRLERARTKGLILDSTAQRVECRLFGASDGVLTVSTALRRYALEHGGRPAHTLVLPNAVDTAHFRPDVNGGETRARLGLAPDAFVVGFAGSLKPWHGMDTLLDAFAVVQAHEPTARLLIVGEGPQGDVLRRRAAGLGIVDAVLFAGQVAHDAMPQMLAAMTVGVAPFLDVPDFYFSPLKIYEYMAAGLAVVASEAGEIATLIDDGYTGLLCPPGDAAALSEALVLLVRDAGLRARLGVAACAEAERHTWRYNARVVSGLAGMLAAPGSKRGPGTQS